MESIKKINMKLLGNRVLIKPNDENPVAGFIISDSAKEKTTYGTVVLIGDGEPDEIDGKKINIRVTIGEKVFFNKFSGTEHKIEGENYILMKISDIIGIFDGGK